MASEEASEMIQRLTVEKLAGRSVSLRSMLALYADALGAGVIDSECTTGRFAHTAVIPLTESSGLSYSEYIAEQHTSDLYSSELLPAECHVVHSWRMKVKDLLTGIAECANHGGPEPSCKSQLLQIPWHEENHPENLNKRFFVCTFTVNQHNVKKHKVGETTCEIDKFDLVMRTIFDRFRNPTLVVLDDKYCTLGRSCCLEEIHAAITHNIPLQYFGTGCVQFKGNIDAMRAEAYDPLMQHLIREKILNMPGGVKEFNRVVEDHLTEFANSNLQKFKKRISRIGVDTCTHDFSSASCHSQSRESKDEPGLLYGIPLFQEACFDAEILDFLQENMERRVLQKSDVVIEEGKLEQRPGLYILIKGTMSLSKGGIELSKLSKGEVFGEKAVFDLLAVRGATITALCLSTVYFIPQSIFAMMVETFPSGRKNISNLRDALQRRWNRAQRLHESPVLRSAGFSGAFLDSLSKRMETRIFEPGATIMKEGDLDDGRYMYVICQGSVAVSKGGEEVAVLNNGALFGERAIFDVTLARSATVTVLEEATLLCISQGSFVIALEQFPDERVKLTSLAKGLLLPCHRSQSMMSLGVERMPSTTATEVMPSSLQLRWCCKKQSAPSRVPYLEDWLESLFLDDLYCDAHAWCTQMGARTVEDIVDHIEEFAGAFHQLKPYDRDRLRKHGAKRWQEVQSSRCTVLGCFSRWTRWCQR